MLSSNKICVCVCLYETINQTGKGSELITYKAGVEIKIQSSKNRCNYNN